MTGQRMKPPTSTKQNPCKYQPYNDNIKAHNARILTRIRLAVTAFDREWLTFADRARVPTLAE
jgi:hypothetical protein